MLLGAATDLLRVEYTLGAFSFATITALLAGTWLGPLRGATTQAAAVALLAAGGLIVPIAGGASSWGFRLGRVASAWLAGRLVPPGPRGARASRRTRWVVIAGGVLTGFAVLRWGLYIGPGAVGGYFALTFLLAAVIAAFYAVRIVPEPQRVVGYVAALIPYYVIGLVGTWASVRYWPEAASDAELSIASVLFHGYLAQLPGDLIGTVVIAYLVCAIDGEDLVAR